MVIFEKRKLFDVESEVTSLNSNPYPDNFYVGQAIGNGGCFFDSFRQSLEQQKKIQVTVEQLRKDCKEFAQNNPPKWFTDAIHNSYDNNGQGRSETVDDYTVNIMNNDRWGDPDIEGRILCGRYGVKLHFVESHNDQQLLLDQLIDSSGSKSVGGYNKVDYDDSSVLHVINKGSAHFEPLLDRSKSLAKQPQEEVGEQENHEFAEKLQQEGLDYQMAKRLQVDEILEYLNIPKDSSMRKEVEKKFDELLAKNAGGEIGDVVKQCVAQHIRCSEAPSCGMDEIRVTSQQTSLSVK